MYKGLRVRARLDFPNAKNNGGREAISMGLGRFWITKLS